MLIFFLSLCLQNVLFGPISCIDVWQKHPDCLHILRLVAAFRFTDFDKSLCGEIFSRQAVGFELQPLGRILSSVSPLIEWKDFVKEVEALYIECNCRRETEMAFLKVLESESDFSKLLGESRYLTGISLK